MAEVAAIHMQGGDMELRHCCRYRARHAGADNESDQFDEGEENTDPDQDVRYAADEFSQRREKMAVENRRPGCDL